MARARWREIADDLLRRIKAEEFGSAGGGRAKLPTELELRDAYNASRNTIREALAWLVERGLLETERGRGTFVVFMSETLHVTMSKRGAEPGGGEGRAWRTDAELVGRRARADEIEVGVKPAPPDVARYLQVPVGTQVILRHLKQYVDELPWSQQTSFYPLTFADRGAKKLLQAIDIEEGTVAYLKETLGYVQGGYHDEIAVRIPNDQETQFFKFAERASVLVYETLRTAYDEKTEEPFRFTVTVWPADRNRLHYNVGKVPAEVVELPGVPHPPKKAAGS